MNVKISRFPQGQSREEEKMFRNTSLSVEILSPRMFVRLPEVELANSLPLDNTCNPKEHFQLEIDSNNIPARSQDYIARNLSISI